MILIVDDQQSMCWILSKVLSEAGFSMKTAETAEEALSIAGSDEVSVAVIDYRLPDKNGFELFSELRERDPHIQAVLITSYGSKELREKALRLGFHSYFDKPFDNRSLIRSLITALENSKPSREEIISTQEHEAPQESEELFLSVFETVPIAVVIADADGKVVQTNHKAQEIFNYTEDEFRSKSFTGLFQVNGAEDNQDLFEELQRKRDRIQTEGRFYRKDGHPRWGDIVIAAVRDAERNLQYIIFMLDDVTEHKEAEEQKLLQSEELTGMGLLAASVAHELGNPLSIMSSTLQYVRDALSSAGNQQLTEAIDTIMDSIGQMHQLLRSLSEFTGSRRPNFEWTDLRLVLSQMLSFINKEAEAHKITTSYKFDKDLPDCQVDQRELKQLFLNLLKNAIEAMPDGGKLSVRMSLFDSKESVCVEVSDTGNGISDADLRTIFKPFYSTKPGGMGLGLTSCRRVVEEHAGEITAESKLDEGSTFKVILPIRQEETDE